MLTKEQILNANNLETRLVNCPGLGGDVLIRALSASERDLFEQRFRNLKEVEPGVRENLRAFFIVHHVVDEATGNLMFTVDDVEGLGRLPAADMDVLFTHCQELSGFGDDDADELKKK